MLINSSCYVPFKNRKYLVIIIEKLTNIIFFSPLNDCLECPMSYLSSLCDEMIQALAVSR